MIRILSAYQVLGLQPGAPDAEIRAAYVALAKKYHPDAASAGEGSGERLKRVIAAYRLLKQENSRQRYNERRCEVRQGRLLISGKQQAPLRPFMAGLAAAAIAAAVLGAMYLKGSNSSATSIVSAPDLSGEPTVQRKSPGKRDALRSWRRPSDPASRERNGQRIANLEPQGQVAKPPAPASGPQLPSKAGASQGAAKQQRPNPLARLKPERPGPTPQQAVQPPSSRSEPPSHTALSQGDILTGGL